MIEISKPQGQRTNGETPHPPQATQLTVAEFGHKVNDSAFSLGNSAIADVLITEANKRVKRPETRARIMGDIARRVEGLKRETDQIVRVAGRDVTQKAIVDPRTIKSLRKESAVREAVRREELEGAVISEKGFILENEELAKLKNQPVHSSYLRASAGAMAAGAFCFQRYKPH